MWPLKVHSYWHCVALQYSTNCTLIAAWLHYVVIIKLHYCVFTTDIDWRSHNLRHHLSQHGAPIGGIWGFPAINSSGAYVLQSVRENKHTWNAAQWAKIVDPFCLRLLLHVWWAKTRIPPIGALWLMMPLHRAV